MTATRKKNNSSVSREIYMVSMAISSNLYARFHFANVCPVDLKVDKKPFLLENGNSSQVETSLLSVETRKKNVCESCNKHVLYN